MTIDGLQIILGPRVNIAPRNMNAEDELNYYSDNYYNIFTHKIQLACKGSHLLTTS